MSSSILSNNVSPRMIHLIALKKIGSDLGKE